MSQPIPNWRDFADRHEGLYAAYKAGMSSGFSQYGGCHDETFGEFLNVAWIKPATVEHHNILRQAFEEGEAEGYDCARMEE